MQAYIVRNYLQLVLFADVRVEALIAHIYSSLCVSNGSVVLLKLLTLRFQWEYNLKNFFFYNYICC